MSVIRISLLTVVALLMGLSVGVTKQAYSKKEGRPCTFCHPAGKFRELTDAGRYYKEHNYSLDGYKAGEAKK